VTVCDFDAKTHTVTASVDSGDPQFEIMRDGNNIVELNTDCGDATRFNTDKIVINDGYYHDLDGVIRLSGGPFKPGFTNEPGASDEIEFVFNFGGDTFDEIDHFYVKGDDGPVADTIRLGKGSAGGQVNLNAGEITGVDRDVVIKTPDLHAVGIYLYGAPDAVNAGGGLGTGESFTDPIDFRGSGGKDTFIGGAGSEYVLGGGGADKLLGGSGNDELFGNDGDDLLEGQSDNDLLFGHSGNDTLRGGSGEDVLCEGGAGNDDISGCET
jgi:Ca2+-binding RTX toxin-like protein